MKLTDEQLAYKCEELTGIAALGYVAKGCHCDETPSSSLKWFEFQWNLQTRLMFADISDTLSGRQMMETRVFESCYDDFRQRVEIIIMAMKPNGLEAIVSKVLRDEAMHQSEVDPIERAREAFGRPAHRNAAPLVANLAGKLRERWSAAMFLMKDDMLTRYAKSHLRTTWAARMKAKKMAEVSGSDSVD